MGNGQVVRWKSLFRPATGQARLGRTPRSAVPRGYGPGFRMDILELSGFVLKLEGLGFRLQGTCSRVERKERSLPIKASMANRGRLHPGTNILLSIIFAARF